MKRLRVHFDQNCINAKAKSAALNQVQKLHDTGMIALVASARNRWELGDPQCDGPYKRKARTHLERFEVVPEYFRWNISPMGSVYDDSVGAVWGSVTDPESLDLGAVWRAVFPKSPMPYDPHGRSIFEPGQNSVHDVMHLVNAHDHNADVFLTEDQAVLRARDRLYAELSFRPRIESCFELLLRFSVVLPLP